MRTLAHARVLRAHGFQRRSTAFVRAAGTLEQVLTLQRFPAWNDEVVGLRWHLIVTGSADGHRFERWLDFQAAAADSVVVAPYGGEEREEASLARPWC